MRKLLLLCVCVLVPFVSFAQKDTTGSYDYSKIFGSKDEIIARRLCTIDNLNERGSQYKKHTNDLDKILMVSDPAILSYGKRLTGQDRILADPGTIRSIQNKLSNISKEYKDYLERGKDADKGFVVVGSYYSIDGKRFFDGVKETVFELYKLRPEGIKSLKLEVKWDGNYEGAVREYNIIITTKN